jgi:hypothetical protein
LLRKCHEDTAPERKGFVINRTEFFHDKYRLGNSFKNLVRRKRGNSGLTWVLGLLRPSGGSGISEILLTN